MIKLLFLIILLQNICVFILMGADKRLAVNGGRRIPEKVLLAAGSFLGGLGLLLGALVFHHKTRKWKFRIGIPVAIIISLLISMFFVNVFIWTDVRDEIVFSVQDHSGISLDAAEALKAGDYQCAMVLGCAAYADGEPSPMLKDRLDAGIDLYRAGAVPKLLLTGDHGQVEYDEISAMYNYCLNAGIPAEDIFLDHAGFSTYDSVYRAQSIFCVERMVIVTQTYHEFRALHIADQLGITAVGVSSDQQHYPGAVYREIRELLARNKDYFKALLKAKPVYGGDEIPITGSPDASHEGL